MAIEQFPASGMGFSETRDRLNEIVDAVSALQVGGVPADSIGDTMIDWGLGAGQVSGADVPLSVAGFAGNLGSGDTDVQVALGTLDDLVASASVRGTVELATAAETTTGTDATRAVTPDGLAGSGYGKESLSLQVFAAGVAVAVGDGKAVCVVPARCDGWNLVGAWARCYSVGTGSTLLTIQLRRRRDATDADMLSTRITVDAAEYSSRTAATACVIDAANDDVQHDATNGIDLIEVDVDAVPETTVQNGLWVEVELQAP